jgi:hypothetical protein
VRVPPLGFWLKCPCDLESSKCGTKESSKLTLRCAFMYIIHVPWLLPPAVDPTIIA